MKSHLKHSLHLCLIVSALMLTACGKKENKVGTGTYSGSSPFSSDNGAFSTTVGSTMIQQAQSIKSNVACLNGGYRLTNDVSFHLTNGSLSGSKIAGNWAPNFEANGTVSKMWIGVSAFRDLMFVTQVANGSTVTGFNVTISFCELKNSYSGLPSIVSNERSLDTFAAPCGIVLDSNTYCGYSVVDLAQNTTIISRRNTSNPYSPQDAQIPTSFTKPSCNGQF